MHRPLMQEDLFPQKTRALPVLQTSGEWSATACHSDEDSTWQWDMSGSLNAGHELFQQFCAVFLLPYQSRLLTVEWGGVHTVEREE